MRDEIDEIRAAVARAQAAELDALLMTGGTGVAPRDCTPEAVKPLLDVELPGFGELFRMLSYAEIGAASCSVARWLDAWASCWCFVCRDLPTRCVWLPINFCYRIYRTSFITLAIE